MRNTPTTATSGGVGVGVGHQPRTRKKYWSAVVGVTIVTVLVTAFVYEGLTETPTSKSQPQPPPRWIYLDHPELEDNFTTNSDIHVKPWLWPAPEEIRHGSRSLVVDPNISIDIKTPDQSTPSRLLSDVVQILRDKIKLFAKRKATSDCPSSTHRLLSTLTITLQGNDEKEGVYTYPEGSNEGYSLVIHSNGLAEIAAVSVHGIIRGTQTFQQLVSDQCMQIVGVPIEIHDKPGYSWRGLLLDPARNFWPLESLRKVVDIMAQAKMNALHLHLTDDQGFAIEVKKYPDLAVPSDIFVEFQNDVQGDIEPIKYYYTQEEMSQFIEYAIRRGIRIIPEFGVPGHTGAWYKAGIVSKCPSIACSRAWSLTLNPLLDKTYEVIKGVLEEMSILFPDPFMHLGGDEVWADCWKEDPNARQGAAAGVQIFEDKLWPIIANLPRSKSIIRWEETYKWQKRSEPYIIQFWLTPEEKYFTTLPRKAIQSTGWYYNHNAGGIGCQNWKECYWKEFPKATQVLGGEGCAWEMRDFHFFSEQVPLRVIATGERLWGTGAPIQRRSEYDSLVSDRMKHVCTILAHENLVPPTWCTLSGPSEQDKAKHIYDFAVNEVERDSMICHRMHPFGSCTTKNCIIDNWIVKYRDTIDSFYNSFKSQSVCKLYRNDENTRMEIEPCQDGSKEKHDEKPTEVPIKPKLWPEPVVLTYGGKSLTLSTTFKVQIESKEPSEFLMDVVTEFEERLRAQNSGQCLEGANILKVLCKDEQPGTYTYPNGDNERYILDLATNGSAVISADSVHGIVRGLQTLLQLGHSEHACSEFQGVPIHIEDKPRLAHRGLLLDPARNFWPLSSLYKVIDIMASAKMNVLHLHLTDDQGFTVESKKYPDITTPSDVFVHFEHNLKQKPKDPTKFFYTQEELKQLIDTAIRLGVRILPEFGVPGHTGAWFKAGIIANCPHFACSRAWSMVMNPTLEKTYEVIQGVLTEMSELFPDPVMHLGGDEVWNDCWREDSSISSYMSKNGITSYDAILHNFEDRLWNIIQNLPQPKTIIRQEPYIIQYWQTLDHNKFNSLPKDKKAIQSTGWYYNHNAGGIGCQNWKECYWKEFPKATQVLGGEGCAWEMRDFHFFSEQVPLRVIATAERLWGTGVALEQQGNQDISDGVVARFKHICSMLANQQLIPSQWCDLTGPSSHDVNQHIYDFAVNEVERDSMICHRTAPRGSCTTKNCIITNWIAPYRDKIDSYYSILNDGKQMCDLRRNYETRIEVSSC